MTEHIGFRDENGKWWSHAGQHSDQNGSFEVFWVSTHDLPNNEDTDQPGWYWWSCSPGCLPDGEAHGPYATSHEAWQAATDPC